MYSTKLKDYELKRDFARTPEPSGLENQTDELLSFPRFVVQEHHASRLHWDLRLEKDGVLKSWAVPKGIPLEKGIKRLAVQVEDHPLSYIDFNGVIPEGNYGSGQVLIWDKGYYATAVYDDDRVEVAMMGRKVRGAFKLVRTKNDQWLLFKTADEDESRQA